MSAKLGLKIDTFLTLMGTRPIWVNLSFGDGLLKEQIRPEILTALVSPGLYHIASVSNPYFCKGSYSDVVEGKHG